MNQDDKDAEDTALLYCIHRLNTVDFYKEGFIHGRKGYIKADKAIEVVAFLHYVDENS